MRDVLDDLKNELDVPPQLYQTLGEGRTALMVVGATASIVGGLFIVFGMGAIVIDGLSGLRFVFALFLAGIGAVLLLWGILQAKYLQALYQLDKDRELDSWKKFEKASINLWKWTACLFLVLITFLVFTAFMPENIV